ncbi:hypothetical protein GOP47_0020664 [Adiantum capillus-veneris]|uniref:Exostosin GT47 domain-containing protein n=1 Tax=Adiantum capillus-veneris TaxID=13818 RepID=A0A9D4U9K0_ADICA|nr:hypothetical protein GOP47_0020664 [Adiantum capillus-veneris]
MGVAVTNSALLHKKLHASKGKGGRRRAFEGSKLQEQEQQARKAPMKQSPGANQQWSHLLFLILLAGFGLRAFVAPQARVAGHEGHLMLNEDPMGRLKVYVYDIPSIFNKWVVQRDMRCLSHMFAIEIYMHLFLLSSSVRTFDPKEADWFYTPVYTNCDLTKTGLPFINNMPRMMRSAIQYISTEWPFWNRTDGADHFFVVPHDFGACFHFQEKEAVERGIFPLLQRATLLQTFGQTNHSCLRNGSIVIPPYVSPRRSSNHTIPFNTPRSTFAYFRGVFYDMNDSPKGDHYARGIRAAIWEKYKNNALFDISSEHPDTYYEDMQTSIFCLCPLGWAPWSPRLVEAVVFGCIPVIIADDIVLPFKEVIPWDDIAVFVPETDVDKLEHILTSIPVGEVTKKQRMMSDPRIKQALLFPRPTYPGDGFHQVMNALARKLPHDSSIYLQLGQPSTLNWTAGNSSEFKPWQVPVL